MRCAFQRCGGATLIGGTRCYTVWMNSIKKAGREPLTRAELQDIQGRLRGSEDGRALLWELFRLRALTLRTHDYLRVNPQSSTAGIMRDALLRDLNAEPVVQEQPKL